MLKLNLVLVLLFINVSVFAEDEKFIGCVLERYKMSGPMLNSDSTDVIKTNEPLISIKDGDFEMLIGNEFNEELFPDGIDYHFIGKPKPLTDNVYLWTYNQYRKGYGGFELNFVWSIALKRDDLILTMNYRKENKLFGGYDAQVKTHSCRLIDKVTFEKYTKEMSEKYVQLNEEIRKELSEAESKRKI